MTEALRMDVEQLREQAGELAIEQHLLLSGWVYGFTDQAHKRIYDLLADDKVLPVDLDKALIFDTNPSPSPKGQKIGAVGPAAYAEYGHLSAADDGFGRNCHHRQGESAPKRRMKPSRSMAAFI